MQQVAQVLKDEVQKVMGGARHASGSADRTATTATASGSADHPTATASGSARVSRSPTATAAAQPITPQQPTKQYTKDEIARACAPLANDPESMRMLQELLASYNAVSLHDLDKSQYPDFADKLRNLGVSV